jgi:hypothetical protein
MKKFKHVFHKVLTMPSLLLFSIADGRKEDTPLPIANSYKWLFQIASPWTISVLRPNQPLLFSFLNVIIYFLKRHPNKLEVAQIMTARAQLRLSDRHLKKRKRSLNYISKDLLHVYIYIIHMLLLKLGHDFLINAFFMRLNTKFIRKNTYTLFELPLYSFFNVLQCFNFCNFPQKNTINETMHPFLRHIIIKIPFLVALSC